MIPKIVTDHAACKGRDAEKEFYRHADSVKNPREQAPLHADHICFTCPVMLECREHALYNEAFGTWGGMKEYELNAERKRLGISSPPYGIGVIVMKGTSV